MNFDRVASHYHGLETIVFGNQLQQARVAFIGEIERSRRVLIVGEGNGRFLAELHKASEAEIDCIEASSRMISLARKRAGVGRTNFVLGDIREVPLLAKHYDLIVSHFFLDCFAEAALSEVIAKLATAAAPNARWLIADFRCPPRGWRRWRARTLVGMMYLFFRAVAGIEARHLADYSPFLRASGFSLTKELSSRHGEICSQLWQHVVPGEAEESRSEAPNLASTGPFDSRTLAPRMTAEFNDRCAVSRPERRTN